MNKIMSKIIAVITFVGMCFALSSCDLNRAMKGEVADGYYIDSDNQVKFKMPSNSRVSDDRNRYFILNKDRPEMREVHILPSESKNDPRVGAYIILSIYYEKMNALNRDSTNKLMKLSKARAYRGEIIHQNIQNKADGALEEVLIKRFYNDSLKEGGIIYYKCTIKNGFIITIDCSIRESKFDREYFDKLFNGIITSFESI